MQFLLVRFSLLAKRRIEGDDALDIAQDACLTVIEKYRTEAPAEKFEAWAYGILKRKIGNYYQKRSVREKVMAETERIEEYPEPGVRQEEAYLRRALLHCLKTLTREFPQYARVINMVYQGYDTNEVCQRLGLKPGYVYVILNRGRGLLQACLKKRGG